MYSLVTTISIIAHTIFLVVFSGAVFTVLLSTYHLVWEHVWERRITSRSDQFERLARSEHLKRKVLNKPKVYGSENRYRIFHDLLRKKRLFL